MIWAALCVLFYTVGYKYYESREETVRRLFWTGKCNAVQTWRLKSQGEVPINYDEISQLENSDAQIAAIIQQTSEWGCLPFEHWFRIGVRSDDIGWSLPPDILRKNPDVIWLYLEYQFAGLSYLDIFGAEYIRVTLYFDDVATPLTIPINSITYFDDPSRDFVVQIDED